MTLRDWLRRTEWLWMIIGGFYLVAYLFWYIPALRELPDSVRDPPAPYPWHWTLDFVATGVAGGVLLVLGFGRATELTASRTEHDQ
jgi:amino acid transporter